MAHRMTKYCSVCGKDVPQHKFNDDSKMCDYCGAFHLPKTNFLGGAGRPVPSKNKEVSNNG